MVLNQIDPNERRTPSTPIFIDRKLQKHFIIITHPSLGSIIEMRVREIKNGHIVTVGLALKRKSGYYLSWTNFDLNPCNQFSTRIIKTVLCLMTRSSLYIDNNL